MCRAARGPRPRRAGWTTHLRTHRAWRSVAFTVLLFRSRHTTHTRLRLQAPYGSVQHTTAVAPSSHIPSCQHNHPHEHMNIPEAIGIRPRARTSPHAPLTLVRPRARSIKVSALRHAPRAALSSMEHGRHARRHPRALTQTHVRWRRRLIASLSHFMCSSHGPRMGGSPFRPSSCKARAARCERDGAVQPKLVARRGGRRGRGLAAPPLRQDRPAVHHAQWRHTHGRTEGAE